MGKKNRQNTDAEEQLDQVEEIETVEETPQIEAEPAPAQAEKVQFDSWWAIRSSVIPAIHKKEIIKADFKGRKVEMDSTMAKFDEALKQYGVKLV